MNRKIILLGCIASSIFISAQKLNKAPLNKALEKQRVENQSKFDVYWNKLSTSGKKTQEEKNLKERKLAFFFGEKPYFLKSKDGNQNKNSNVDFLHNTQVAGLSKAFKGEGLTLYQFDGGRIYAAHSDFKDASGKSRASNGERSSVPYDDHATNVAGMMVAQGADIEGTLDDGTKISGNTQGAAPLAKVVGYSFETTTLPGKTVKSTVHQKIESVKPHISNHSYGANMGWSYEEADPDNLGAGWYWGGTYDSTDHSSYDLQGTYFENDRDYDRIVRENPSMIIVKAAGNSFGDGPAGNNLPAFYGEGSVDDPFVKFTGTMQKPQNNCATGYDCIGSGSLAKNIIVVGATEKFATPNERYSASSDVVKTDFSSAGPRDDGGIKPDITGVGNDVFSAAYDGGESYTMGGGTSYSSPSVTGIIGLWDTIYTSFFSGQNLNAAKAKTLLVHSAMEAGNTPGPDAWFGWGFVDAKKGAELLVGKNNDSVIFEEPTLANNGKYTKDVSVRTNGFLKVTISWVDPEYTVMPTTWGEAHNNRTSKLINDLDLRVIDTTTNTAVLPWKLDLNNLAGGAIQGDNTVDNVEQVIIPNAVANRVYRIEVSHKRTLQGGSDQNFAIIAEGQDGITLSTTDFENKKKEVMVYPTIAKEVVNIATSSALVSKVSIYDASGKLVHRQNIDTKGQINVQSYKQGVYIISIENSEGKFSKKFIKE